MAKNAVVRSSRAPKTAAPVVDVDMVIDDDQPIEMVVPVAAAADLVSVNADIESTETLETIARDIVKNTDAAAENAASSVPSAIRYSIGRHAAKIMIRHRCGTNSAAVMIGATLATLAQRTNKPVPRVWRDLVGIEHALKCWIPGCVLSASLPNPWPAVKRYPFYAVPDSIVQRSLAGKRGYDWGGIICDKWSRIDPRILADNRIVMDFDQLIADGAKRIDLYAYLDQYMPERKTK